MSKNQLFKILPDETIINLLLNAFDLQNINDQRYFTKNDMKSNDTVQKITKLKPELNRYYLPCKSKVYLCSINEKKCITILRQFLKTQNYNILVKEKTKDKLKYSTYRIFQDKNKILSSNNEKKRKIIIDFST
tara:strand:- start:38 stop:436 length:399 start_codon:yes stop_codon:yes gene_type:complete